ncbi:MAG TPA: HupE/UreJ family protein [Planctomycetota bacterium]|nr:HupE/UreJ family protein [Planctomycetota bacterium]
MGPLIAVCLLAGLHDERIVTVDVRVGGRELAVVVQIGQERLRPHVKLPGDLLDLTEVQLLAAKAQIADYVRSRLAVTVDGRPAALEPDAMEPAWEPFGGLGEPYIASVLQSFTFAAPEPIREVTVAADFFDVPDARVLVNAGWDGQRRTDIRRTAEPLVLRLGRLERSGWGLAWDFVLLGMHHIFIGFDHVAFLLALLLGAARMGEMVKIVTSFTVAHSLTLLLAAKDAVRVPAQLTEALIAASIVYVAVENYLVKDAKHRWALTFAFGLVHGLGFSEVLREKLGESAGLLLPVVAFNAGVELGQIAILLVAFPLVLAVRHRGERPSRILAWTGSAVVLLFGLGWLIERVFSVEFMPL